MTQPTYYLGDNVFLNIEDDRLVLVTGIVTENDRRPCENRVVLGREAYRTLVQLQQSDVIPRSYYEHAV